MNKQLATIFLFSAAILLQPYAVSAQQQQGGVAANQQTNVPQPAQDAQDAVERVVDRFGIGVTGGVGLDPEIILIGGHATFAPIFSRNVEFRPGFEVGFGELTTLVGINLDVAYFLPGATRTTEWSPYIGAGPNFTVSRRSFETEEGEVDGEDSRFDFSDTDFTGGFNFIAGVRRQNGLFLELKATAWGVSNIRLLAGYNF